MASAAQQAAVFGVVILVVISGIGLWWAHERVPEGYVGVELNRGAATGDVHEPDWHWINPITESIVMVETRPRTVTYNEEQAIYIITEDGQDVWADVTIRYRVEPENAVTFYRVARSHDQAKNRYMDPTVRSSIRDEGGDMDARTIITKDGRLALEDAAEEALRAEFEGTGVTLEAVQLRQIELDEEFSNELEQIEVENARAEQRIIEAESQAEADRIRDQELTEPVLMEKYIDTIDESDTVILATDGDGTPVILNPEQSGGDGMAGLDQDVSLNESVNENESAGGGSEEESADA